MEKFSIIHSPTIHYFQCDHLCSGRKTCPCGFAVNSSVKSVCKYVNGQQTWPTPYSRTGIRWIDAKRILQEREENWYLTNIELLEKAWDEQMISGKEYMDNAKKEQETIIYVI